MKKQYNFKLISFILCAVFTAGCAAPGAIDTQPSAQATKPITPPKIGPQCVEDPVTHKPLCVIGSKIYKVETNE